MGRHPQGVTSAAARGTPRARRVGGDGGDGGDGGHMVGIVGEGHADQERWVTGAGDEDVCRVRLGYMA